MSLVFVSPTLGKPVGRQVAKGTPAPYEMGDIVAVVFASIFTPEVTPRWVAGMVLTCTLPENAIRFMCRVAIGASTHTQVEIPRVYCWENGVGEGLVRLDEENPGAHLDSLNLGPAPLYFDPQPSAMVASA